MGAASLYPGWIAAGLALALFSTSCEPAPPRPALISCAPEITQILLELGAARALVGADADSRRLPGLEAALDLGEACERAPAAAPGLRPDSLLVLGNEPGRALARSLEERGLAVRVLEPRSLDELVEVYQQLGVLAGDAASADRAVTALVRSISSIAVQRDGKRRLRVVWLLARDPLVAVGGEGMLHEMLELAGAENAVHGPAAERVVLGARQLTSSGADLALDSSGVSGRPELQLASRSIPPELAALPALDPLERIGALHELLYPEAAR
jgi:ABC-type hemin transport system substrate-binding protein